MFYWGIFLGISVIAAIFGFTDIAVGFSKYAKILFLNFMIFFFFAILFGWRRKPPSKS